MTKTPQELRETMNKKQFMKMLAEADVDDTTEFWEDVYDSIISSHNSAIVEATKRSLETYVWDMEEGSDELSSIMENRRKLNAYVLETLINSLHKE